jgi:Trk-type K+ transport system membrane component
MLLTVLGYCALFGLASVTVAWFAARMVAGGKTYDQTERENVREFFERRPEQRLHIVNKRSKDVA